MKNNPRFLWLGAFLLASLSALPVNSTVTAGTYFAQGRSRLSLYGGWGTAFNNSYFVLGAGAGYYVLRGLEVGVDGEAWMGSTPQIQKITPEIRYIIPTNTSIFPYIGTFYRRTFYQDLEDLDSVGGRFGVYTPMSERVYLGVGGVFERQLNCNTQIYDHCSVVYPEFSISVGL